jgi:hypothetical protein
MAVSSYNDIIARIGSGYAAKWPFYGEAQVTVGLVGAGNTSIQKIAYARTMPSLPTGVSQYLLTAVQGHHGVGVVRTTMVCEVIDLGSLNIAGPTFTDGTTFPTRTELGSSRQTYGPIFAEVTTALNATPGSIAVTYVDQDGNTAETTSSTALPTSNNGIGTTGFILLNSGDIGAQDITTATRTGGTTPTGVIQFWGILPLCYAATSSTGAIFIQPMLTNGFMWARFGADAKIRIFETTGGTTTAASSLAGVLDIVGDS